MNTIPAYIYDDLRSSRVIISLQCLSVTKSQAKVDADVNLAGSMKPGMVFRLVKGRKAIKASTRVVESIDQKKTGQSTIKFVVPEKAVVDAAKK